MKRFIDNWLPWIVIAGLLAFTFTLIAKAHTQPTTQPATYAQQFGSVGQQIDSLIAAKNAQIAALQALRDPATVPTGADLAALFNAGGITRYGSPGASYVWNTTVRSGMSSGGFIGAANAIVLKPLAGGTTGIAVHDGAELANVNLSGAGLAINATGPMKSGAYLHDLSFGSTLDWGITLDGGADNCTISHSTFAALNEYGVYCTSDNLHLDSCTFGPSITQHNLRFETSNATASKGHRPANAVVSNCTFADNVGTLGDPECFAAREIDGLDAAGDDFYGWVRIGNELSDRAHGIIDTAIHARRIVFTHCTWHKLRPGGALIQIEHDVDIVLVDCTFPGSSTDSPISVGDRSTCTLMNTTLVCPTPAPGTPPMSLKPLVIASSSATVTGADKVNVVYQAGGMR